MKRVGWPLLLSGLLILVYVSIMVASPDWGGLKYLLAACLISMTVVLVRIIGYLLFDVWFQKRKGREAPALLRFLVPIVIYPALFMLIFSVILEKDFTGVLATSAVVSVIIGLALQDTLGNFFAGISLHIEQPYHIGDWIRVGDLQGKVIEVTWRMTKIRTNNNTSIILPNSRVARDPLEIFPYGNLNRKTLIFPAPYSAPPEKVIPLVREAVRTTPKVSPERTPVVRVSEFADSRIHYEILYWVIDFMWTQDLDSKIRERIWYVFRRNGIEMPLPHRQILYPPPAAPTDESEYEEIIDQVELFDPLTPQEKSELAKGIVRYLYAPGETILRRGDPGSSMFVISRGKAEVQVLSNNGDLKAVATLGAGDFFGEMALFTGERRTADVCAVEEVELLEIRKACIEKLLNQNEKLAESFSQKIAERQAGLAEYANQASGEQKTEMQQKTILNRIRRFFKLK
ncbi:MAG TPA: mechanosensitive ion channel family protein [Blastocatellia bacterium]|nr:mechanosensitive ion channel family protein [Blastocatellia bacterium]